MEAQRFVMIALAAVAGFMFAAYLIKQIDKDRPKDQKIFGSFYST